MWRMRYSKLGKIRFTSHRDTATHVERAVRRVGLHVAMSQGFTSRPRISFGLGLPTGAESLAEYLDIDLIEPLDQPAATMAALSDALPVGYTVTALVPRPQGAASLQEAVVSCRWQIDVDGVDGHDLSVAVDRALAAATIPIERERKGQRSVDDVRPAIESLATVTDSAAGRPQLLADLSTSSRGVRPLELLGALMPDLDPIDAARRVLRIEQFIDADGVREPVLAPVGAFQEEAS
jgi:radical SAM-linked protein